MEVIIFIVSLLGLLIATPILIYLVLCIIVGHSAVWPVLKDIIKGWIR